MNDRSEKNSLRLPLVLGGTLALLIHPLAEKPSPQIESMQSNTQLKVEHVMEGGADTKPPKKFIVSDPEKGQKSDEKKSEVVEPTVITAENVAEEIRKGNKDAIFWLKGAIIRNELRKFNADRAGMNGDDSLITDQEPIGLNDEELELYEIGKSLRHDYDSIFQRSQLFDQNVHADLAMAQFSRSLSDLANKGYDLFDPMLLAGLEKSRSEFQDMAREARSYIGEYGTGISPPIWSSDLEALWETMEL